MNQELIKVFAVEDDFIHQENLRITLDELGYELVGLEEKAEKVVGKVKETKPDIVLLDINLAGRQTGIELGYELNQNAPTPIIYVTSYADQEIFQKASLTHPYAYLIKPVEALSLQSSIELALQHTLQPEEPHTQWESDMLFRNSFFVKIGNKLVKIRPEEVKWIEVSGNRYCKIVTEQREAHIRATLNEVQEKLAPSPFVRVHRSFLINPEYLTAIHEANQTLMIDDQEIPLGKTYKEALFDRLRRL
ncbi:MAG: LytTR family transcriptional regulator DNA-binding domain-containing protein [Bacteroidota bacterium]